jgi:hypothetical protein
MSKSTEDKDGNKWSFSVGLYPGILIGMRTYDFEESRMHALYIPFVDFILEFPK